MIINGCSVVPCKSNHAVQLALFALELPATISPESLVSLSTYYEHSPGLKELFPSKTENRGVAISINPQGVGIQNAEAVQGLVFQRFAKDGSVELALTIERNILTYTCNQYTRWNEVSTQAIGLLNEFTKFVCPTPGVAVIGLQYVDEFFVTGNLEEFRPSMVFSKDIKRLPSSILEEKNIWHNHSGWFDSGESDRRKILNNLNVNLLAQPERYVLQVISAHRDILPEPITSADALNQVMAEQFECLHRLNKVLFREILNKETIEAIGLNDESSC